MIDCCYGVSNATAICCFAYINGSRSEAPVLPAMESDEVVLPSLLKAVENLPSPDNSAFDLGASELLGEPSAKEEKLRLTKTRAAKERFRAPLKPEERSQAAKGVIPTNTKNATEWALRNFQQWREYRNQRSPEDPVPEDLFRAADMDVLCKWLCCFVQETRKETGENYPATTLRQMLSAFQRVLRGNKVPFNIFDKTNLRFIELRNTLDTVCVGLKKQGVGAAVAHAPVISIEHEMLMWTSGVLGFEPPEALLRAVFITVGMHCSLRGGQEHYDLKVEQFTQLPGEGYSAETHYRYVENGSKNFQGRSSECGKGNKIVEVFAEPESDRCPVRVLDMYFSKLPENPPAFYLQWLPSSRIASAQYTEIY